MDYQPPYSREIHTFSFEGLNAQLYIPNQQELRNLIAQQENEAIPFPFWARLWPSALALCRFIAANPELIKHKKVLELAAGLGLPGIIAAQHAQEVIISDYLPEAVAMIESSVALNGLNNIYCQQLDWYLLPNNLAAEVLLLSDINYDPTAFEVLYQVLMNFLNKGSTIILTTPQRLMAKPFIEQLLPFCILQDELEILLENEHHFISVLVLGR